MNKGAQWLVVLMVTATVSGDSQVANSSTYLDGAMTGFNPFYMSCLKLPNPGRRSKIFQPLYTLIYSSNKTVLNSFVDEVQDANNLPDITIQKVLNFQQYLDFTTFSSYELSSDLNLGAPKLRYENYSSYETKSHLREHAMFTFFKDTGGEVLFAKTDMVTHTITISPFEISSFTPAFQTALVTLYEAAVNPIPEIRDQIFAEFVKIYGTHFSRRTILGSRAIFGKLFSTRAATVEEEIDRRRCLLEAAREALTPCMRGCNETTHAVFIKASSKCGGEEHEALVTVTGPLPRRNLEDWASAARDSPNPIFHELEPMSKLFDTDWFTKFYDEIQVRINGTILSQYFEEQLYDYNSRMTSGGQNKSSLRGCGLNSDCRLGSECRNEAGTEAGFSCVPEEDAITTTPASTTTENTTTLRPTCPGDGRLNSVYGRVTTLHSHPTFGTSNYDNNILFITTLVAPPGFRVRVRIQSFHTERLYDLLVLYDGSTSLSTRLTTLSGSQDPSTYISSSCTVLLYFKTDSGTTYSGFSLEYDAVI